MANSACPPNHANEPLKRFSAVPSAPIAPLDELWACEVFSLDTRRVALPQEIFKSVQRTSKEGSKLDVSVANVVAQAMKEQVSDRVEQHA